MHNERSELYYFANSRMPKEKYSILKEYADGVLVPQLLCFPKLSGQIFLSLSEYGFISQVYPHYSIVVNKNTIEERSRQRVNSITASILSEFELDRLGMANLPFVDRKRMRLQALFLSFSKGFARDYIYTFFLDCDKQTCDFNYKFNNISCKNIFIRPCRSYSDNELDALADRLYDVTQKNSLLFSTTDFMHIMLQTCKQNTAK